MARATSGDREFANTTPVRRTDGELYDRPKPLTEEWEEGYADAIDAIGPKYGEGWTLIQKREYDEGYDEGCADGRVELGPHR